MEFRKPIPVVTVDGKDGYALYVRDGGTFENDVWCVVLCDGGAVRHYRSDQIRVHANATFGICKQLTATKPPSMIEPKGDSQ
jgi:hypothetical protein